MKKLLVIGLAILTFTLQAEEKSADPIDIEKISETLGHLIVQHLSYPGVQFNFDKIIQGIQEEKAGKPAPMSEEEYEQAVAQIQETIFLKEADRNLKDAVAFLEKNGQRAEIVSVNEKLQYQIDQKGEGDKVGPESIPLVHYTGKLIDGTVFSSSRENDDPISLPIKQTIPGFSQGLVGMQEGEKRTLYIHPELAYGVAGHLPPNSLLIFDVEIIKADSPQEAIADFGEPSL